MRVHEKIEKSRITVCLQWFVTQEGRKVGSLKWQVRSHLARWEMKNCTACSAKHISKSKSKCRKHLCSGALSDVEMSKSALRCGAKHISKSKCTKHTRVGALLEVVISKKWTLLWRKKLSPNWSFQAPKTLPSPHRNTYASNLASHQKAGFAACFSMSC